MGILALFGKHPWFQRQLMNLTFISKSSFGAFGRQHWLLGDFDSSTSISLSNFLLLFHIVSLFLLSWIKTDCPRNMQVTKWDTLWLEMESGGFCCQEKQISGQSVEQNKRDKREKSLDISLWCWRKKKVWIWNNRHWSKNITDSSWEMKKLSVVIGWKKLKTIQVSVPLLSGSMVKNL